MKKWLLILFPALIWGQDRFEYNVQDDLKIEKIATINLREQSDPFRAQISHIEAPNPGGDSYKDYLSYLKKHEIPEYYEGKEIEPQRSPQKISENEPSLGMGFRTFQFAGIPGDNDIAISNEGKLMSVVNNNIYVRDINDPDGESIITPLFDFSEELNLGSFRFDPKVVYDPIADRFILVCLAGSVSFDVVDGVDSPQTIIVAFTDSNDPMDDWNIYAVSGTPLMNGTWSDYPVIGLSRNELFITVNLIQDDSSWQSGFTQSVIWQIFKQDGYVGAAELDSKLYTDIKFNNESIRYITPIQEAGIPTSDNMYFLSNKNYVVTEDTFYTELQNNTMFLLEIEGIQFIPTIELEVNFLQTDVPYGVPSDVRQPFSSDSTFLELNTNDARVLGGYRLGDHIHFVGNTIALPSMRAGIYHGQIFDVQNPSLVYGQILEDPEVEYGYPNISYTGNGFDDQNIITVNHSAENVFPGMSAIFYHNGAYSDRVTVREGETFITYNNMATNKRWGDYSGTQQKYDEPGKVWFSGTFGADVGTLENYYGTYVAEIIAPEVESVATGISSTETELVVFPNPMQDRASLIFHMPQTEIVSGQLIDPTGKILDTVFRGKVKAGRNQFSFQTQSLANGIYFLRLVDQRGQVVLTEEILVQQ